LTDLAISRGIRRPRLKITLHQLLVLDLHEPSLWLVLINFRFSRPKLVVSTYQGQSRAEVLCRTLIADNFNGQHPAPLEAIAKQFISYGADLYGVAMTIYLQEEAPLLSRVVGEMHALLLSKFRRSFREPRASPWLTLLRGKPRNSLFTKDRLETMFSDLLENLIQSSQLAGADRTPASASFPHVDYVRESDLSIGARTLFRTDQNLLGAGPSNLAVGDEVWVLSGCPTPVVLRASKEGKDRRIFLGEAYVHGIMHGEALILGFPAHNLLLE
jgi:hypothetical protein